MMLSAAEELPECIQTLAKSIKADLNDLIQLAHDDLKQWIREELRDQPQPSTVPFELKTSPELLRPSSLRRTSCEEWKKARAFMQAAKAFHSAAKKGHMSAKKFTR